MTATNDLLEGIRKAVTKHFTLTADQFDTIFEKARLVELEPKTVLFTEGKYHEYVYFIAQGKAEIYKEDKLLNSVTLGDILGEMSLIGRDASTATVIAQTSMKLFRFRKDLFATFLNRFPNMNNAVVMETINRRTQQHEL